MGEKMSKPAFTPGPWWVDKRFRVLAADERHTIVHVPPGSFENLKREADARLIAAAPDLYAALAAEVAYRAPTDGLGEYQCARGYDVGNPECDCVDCVRHRTSVAALARARGET